MKFEKGQWYSDGEKFWMYDTKHLDGYHYFRLAGGKVSIPVGVEFMKKASLTPDFSNAPEFGDCFNVIEGICKYRIDDNGVWIADGRYNLDGRYLNRDKHPTLFNSFAQFLAYWQEEALKLKGEEE